MPEPMTQKELNTLMEKLFSINPKDAPFFKKQFSEIAKTDSGTRLLRSLNEHFNGKRMNLVTHAKQGAFAHCFDDEYEIGVGVSGLLDYYLPSRFPLTIKREVEYGYPKLLFHELTHLEQYRNQGGAENAVTDQDRYFTTIMGEADAQVSGDLFKMQLTSSSYFDKGILNPAWQIAKLVGMIVANSKLNFQKKFLAKTRQQLQETHPEWHRDRIEQEVRKTFLKNSILDKSSSWRRFYDKPENRRALGILNDDSRFSKKEFPDLMRYYMDKYGLTLEECLDLKKEILAQSEIKFFKQTMHSSTPHQTNAQVLSHASSMQREQPIITPKTKPKTEAQKLDPAFLSHFGKDGQGK